MKNLMLSFLITVAIFCAGSAFTIQNQALTLWGYDGKQLATEWVGPDGSINFRSEVSNQRSAIMLFPSVNGTGPDFGAATEYVLYRKTDGTANHPEQNFERFSISAMAFNKELNKEEGMLRFSNERGGNGQFREFWFGYDTFQPGWSYFPLRVTPDGVFVCDISASQFPDGNRSGCKKLG